MNIQFEVENRVETHTNCVSWKQFLCATTNAQLRKRRIENVKCVNEVFLFILCIIMIAKRERNRKDCLWQSQSIFGCYFRDAIDCQLLSWDFYVFFCVLLRYIVFRCKLVCVIFPSSSSSTVYSSALLNLCVFTTTVTNVGELNICIDSRIWSICFLYVCRLHDYKYVSGGMGRGRAEGQSEMVCVQVRKGGKWCGSGTQYGFRPTATHTH